MSEAECIVEHIVAEDPDLFDVLVEAEMNESDLDDTDDLSATDATLVLNAAADCTRNSVSTLLQSENNLSADQAECLFDEIYGPDSVTMGFIALAAEMELMGVSEDEPEFVEAATEMMMVLMGSHPASLVFAAQTKVSSAQSSKTQVRMAWILKTTWTMSTPTWTMAWTSAK